MDISIENYLQAVRICESKIYTLKQKMSKLFGDPQYIDTEKFCNRMNDLIDQQTLQVEAYTYNWCRLMELGYNHPHPVLKPRYQRHWHQEKVDFRTWKKTGYFQRMEEESKDE